MDKYKKILYKLNCLAADLDALYHKAALKLGISDNILLVLYLLYANNGEKLLNDIRKEANMNKQTLNSSIRKLEIDGILVLEQHDNKMKKVILTKKGIEFTEQNISRLYNTEIEILQNWDDEDIFKYIDLMKKYNDDFRKKIEKM